MRVAGAVVGALALAACSASGPTRTQQPPPTAPSTSAVTSAVTAAPTTTTSCTTASVIHGWSLTRRAAAVVAVPVLDFDVAGAAPELRAGAGGLLFLGNAPAPRGLAAQLRAGGASQALVMADEEGGGVSRLAPVVAPVPWAQDMAGTMTPAQVQAVATRVARQMRAAGVTVDLAPVLDVDARPGPSATNPDGKRAFGGTASVVSSYGEAFVRGLRAGGVLPVVKHFPGLGGSTGNTDVSSARTQSLTALRRVGLAPFRAAIAAGAPAVMVANASVPGLTSLPASLSRAVITGLLRSDLAFHGLVVTDSLSAGAVQRVTPSLAAAVVDAVAAGADIVLFGSTLTGSQRAQLAPAAVRRNFTAVVDALVAAVRAGRLPVSQLDAAVGAVMTATRAHLCR